MSRAERLAGQAAGYLDLAEVAFTLPGSRLLVRDAGDGALSVSRAEYEVDPDDAVAVRSLTVSGEGGNVLPVTRVLVDRIEFGHGAATLTFGSADELSIGGAARCTLTLADNSTVDHSFGGLDGLIAVAADGGVRIAGDTGHGARLAGTRRVWLDWFDRCPRVRSGLEATAAHCWWVLGANQVELGLVPGSRAVVPSKLGYVGLWQWDAYFIAIGLRHGDLGLAMEQLDLALAHQGDDGQLPDVIHDQGVLASSDDLPPADLVRLRELASPAARPGVRVPLTKPPLAALALCRLAASGAPDAWQRKMLSSVRASQQWWFDRCLGADGLPEYNHPYSSGLDDSPVFDTDLPVATPDLAAYLELQDLLLAALSTSLGEPEEAGRHRARATESRRRLLSLWQPSQRRFAPRGARGPIAAHTVVDLLPLLTGTLPADVVEAVATDLQDPLSFGSLWPVPTVALNDPDFSAERMWRGPTWINTNWLLVEGLERSGLRGAARHLAERSLALVRSGAHEYYNPLSGARPARSVPMFSWTAALFLDLAVRYGQP